MQMKKNYLLLFLIALLFGTATMRGQSLPWEKLSDDGKGFTVKIGKGYLKITKEKATCDPDFSKLPKLVVSKQDDSPKINIASGDNTLALSYNYKKKDLNINGTNQTFLYEKEGEKYYIKAPGRNSKPSLYITNKGGELTLEAAPSEDAVVEITRKAVGGGGNLNEVGQQYHNALALLQFHHEETGATYDSEGKLIPGNIDRKNGPFIGSGLGQYDISAITKVTWNEVANRMFKGGVTPEYNEDNIPMHEDAISGLKITTVTPGYVYVTTKSKFEDAVRENTKTAGYSNTPISTLVPEHKAKYLKATASGYSLTENKSEASVFYFDGNHLTGLDYGFGLNTTQNKYDLTEDAQKAVVKQGKLEKTLDAGSYSLKVGNKFVKLDNAGLSVTDNESESHIFLEEATEFKLNTDGLGYVSFFAPTAVEILDNVEVYTGKLNAQNSVVNLKKVNTKKIPANTAVLLRKGTSKTSFTVKKIASAPAITDNALKGYTVSSNQRVANAYGFAVQNNKLVFIPLNDGVRAFKAVIFNGNAAGMQEFIPTSFAPTGIEGVTAEENKEEIFDLTGRRVESPVKGQVYVKGGKKFIQK